MFKLRIELSLCDDDCKDMISYLEDEISDANCCHCTERTTPIVIDEDGRCRIAAVVGNLDHKLNGHPSLCITSGCDSKLRILRAVSPHYPMLCKFLSLIYDAIRCHNRIYNIDRALKEGDFVSLARFGGITTVKKLFGGESDSKKKPLDLQQPNLPDLESELIIDNAEMIFQLDKLLADNPEFACCSCERLFQRKNVTAFFMSDSKKFTSDIWQILKAYMLMCDADATEHKQYVCQYCRPISNRNSIPNRCVLNGLEVEPVPFELENLDPHSKQLTQRDKAFQAVFKLGTYMGKFPSHNSIKVCKGTMFFLPLPLETTVQTLEKVKNKEDGVSVALPNPELFIIVI